MAELFRTGATVRQQVFKNVQIFNIIGLSLTICLTCQTRLMCTFKAQTPTSISESLCMSKFYVMVMCRGTHCIL